MPSPEDEQKNGDEKFSKMFQDTGPFFGSGIQLAATIVIMFFIGRWVDKTWNTTPWGMIGCVFFGAAAGLVYFIREVIAFDKKESNRKKK